MILYDFDAFENGIDDLICHVYRWHFSMLCVNVLTRDLYIENACDLMQRYKQ